ncbi:hypothetical protein [Achromobacter sp. SLBN-14]|uniref:hypothetical protein n=1 Tax=Achromobacter sp. SLBN-14 TaxID=2768442 RepID=UPI001153AB56|nr:hypothetical protein [Achromobacter sp. SLBN-14]
MRHKLQQLFKRHAVRDGHMRYGYIVFLVLLGGALVLADLYRWHTEWLYIFGLGIAAFGGYSAQAYLLKIRPFEDPPYPPKWLDKRKNEGEK